MSEITYNQVFELYYEQHAKQYCARPKDIERAFQLHFSDLKDMQVTAIRRLTVQAWVNSLAANVGEQSAIKHFTQLRAVLRWGQDMDLYKLEKDPTIKVVTPKNKSRREYLKKDEFERFASALSQQSDLIRDFFLVLFLTGARKSNVLSMSWDQLDLGAGLWLVPTSKNGEPLTLVLSQRAIEILQERKRSADSPWVFPGVGKTGHLVHVGKAWGRIKQLANLPKLRPHDLRRTVGCWMAQEGVSLQIIGETLGHKSYDSTLVYAHVHKAPVREALETIQSSLPLTAKPTAKIAAWRLKKTNARDATGT